MRHKRLRLVFKSFFVLLVAVSLVAASFPATQIQARTIKQIQKQQQQLQNELNSLNAQLVSLLAQIQSLEAEIAENETEIAETELNLKDAQEAEQRQYQEMMLRMQYMYENDDSNLMMIFLESKSFSDFLNKIEYQNAVYDYDRLLLDTYEAIRVEIEGIKADLESQRASLASQKEQLSATKVSLNSLIESKKNEVADINAELEAARAEAARQAAAQAAAREQARANKNAQANNTGVGGGDPAPTTGVSGGAVVSYASQFVGGKYVWGGNSLTSGVDCSGFVVQVYAHFGINLSGARSSAALRGVGKAVSYDSMKAGDIVCYSGHVGIYTGAGTIVEAQSSRAGITNSRSVNCKSILAIRRVI